MASEGPFADLKVIDFDEAARARPKYAQDFPAARVGYIRRGTGFDTNRRTGGPSCSPGRDTGDLAGGVCAASSAFTHRDEALRRGAHMRMTGEACAASPRAVGRAADRRRASCSIYDRDRSGCGRIDRDRSRRPRRRRWDRLPAPPVTRDRRRTRASRLERPSVMSATAPPSGSTTPRWACSISGMPGPPFGPSSE